jgi:hypothetical protein
MEEQTYAVPFALVGFFLTSKPIEESIRNDVAPEELEKLQEIISRATLYGGCPSCPISIGGSTGPGGRGGRGI